MWPFRRRKKRRRNPPADRKQGVAYGGYLTPLEVETLAMIADGLSNKEIKEIYVVAENTIKSRVQGIYAKLGARNRANSVAIGFREGWLSMPSPEESTGPSITLPPKSGKEWSG